MAAVSTAEVDGRTAEREPKAPLVVELPVCDACEHVGKLPGAPMGIRLTGYCTGPTKTPHAKVRRTYRTFVEVVADD